MLWKLTDEINRRSRLDPNASLCISRYRSSYTQGMFISMVRSLLFGSVTPSWRPWNEDGTTCNPSQNLKLGDRKWKWRKLARNARTDRRKREKASCYCLLPPPGETAETHKELGKALTSVTEKHWSSFGGCHSFSHSLRFLSGKTRGVFFGGRSSEK